MDGAVSWSSRKEALIGKECIVYRMYNDGSASVSFEDSGNGYSCGWLASALEPIHETPSVWWPVENEKVLYEGKVRIVKNVDSVGTHFLDSGQWVSIGELLPAPDFEEITPDEAIALLEKHTGQSYKIKGV